MKMFEQVSSLDHQMSVAGGQSWRGPNVQCLGRGWGRGSQCPMSGEGEGPGGALYSEA